MKENRELIYLFMKVMDFVMEVDDGVEVKVFKWDYVLDKPVRVK